MECFLKNVDVIYGYPTKIWNIFILNRLNVKLYSNFCKMKVKSICNLSYNLLKILSNKFIQNLISRMLKYIYFINMFYL